MAAKKDFNTGNWSRLSRVPVEHLRTINFGNLKGKSDISPQWRIKAMTEVYGDCGIGWYHECVDEKFQSCTNGEILVFITVNVFTKGENGWSKPIQGKGGNKVIIKNKNGLVPNDEGVKMAYTDALGTALKCLGVASEIYEGNFDGSKYIKNSTPATPPQGGGGGSPKPAVKKVYLNDCNELIQFARSKGMNAMQAVEAAEKKYLISPEMKNTIIDSMNNTN